MELTGFDAALADCDLVLTGEGRIDEQTGFRQDRARSCAASAGRPQGCICFCGGATPEGIAALAALGALTVPTVEQPMTTSEAIALGAAPIVRASNAPLAWSSIDSVK